MNNKFEMKNNNNNKNEYLSTRQVYNIPNEKFNSYLANNFDSNDLLNLKNTIIKTGFPNPESIPRPTIGKLTFLSKLIEQYYNFSYDKKREMINKYSLLSQDIFK
jgi:hypothetical protein